MQDRLHSPYLMTDKQLKELTGHCAFQRIEEDVRTMRILEELEEPEIYECFDNREAVGVIRELVPEHCL